MSTALLAFGGAPDSEQEMVLLPGRLQSASLAETLRLLHRAGVSGTLSLLEGVGSGQRVHRVVWLDGFISAVLSWDDRRTERSRSVESPTPSRQMATLKELLKTPGLRLRFNTSRTPQARTATQPHVGMPQANRSRGPTPPARRVAAFDPASLMESLGGWGHRTERARVVHPLSPAEQKLSRARQLLDVTASASPQHLRRAFRRAAFRWHPDRFQTAAVGVRRHARIEFASIAAAYELLVGRAG